MHRILLAIILGVFLSHTLAPAMTKPSMKRWETHSFDWGNITIWIETPKGMKDRPTGAWRGARRLVQAGDPKHPIVLMKREYIYRPRIIPIPYGDIEVTAIIWEIPEKDIPYVDEHGLGEYQYKLEAEFNSDPESFSAITFPERASVSIQTVGLVRWQVFQKISENLPGERTEMAKDVYWMLRLDRNHYFAINIDYINNVRDKSQLHGWYKHAQMVEQEIIRRVRIEGLPGESDAAQ